MIIVGIDISKKSTGISFYDGKIFTNLQTVTFDNCIQWEEEMTKILMAEKIDSVVFSETMNFKFGQDTKRIMYGLMYHLELICRRLNIPVVVINDSPAKHHLGILLNKENKEKTLQWANKFVKVSCDDISDSMSFAFFIYNTCIKK